MGDRPLRRGQSHPAVADRAVRGVSSLSELAEMLQFLFRGR
jgi:hypothetical protein